MAQRKVETRCMPSMTVSRSPNYWMREQQQRRRAEDIMSESYRREHVPSTHSSEKGVSDRPAKSELHFQLRTSRRKRRLLKRFERTGRERKQVPTGSICRSTRPSATALHRSATPHFVIPSNPTRERHDKACALRTIEG
jgi:hypothetical protein